MNHERIDELVLAALDSAAVPGPAPGELVAALHQVLRHDVTREELRHAVDHSLRRLVGAHMVERTGSGVSLTSRGEMYARAAFGGDAFADASRYRILAGALGVGHAPEHRLRGLARVENLRAEVLRQRFDLSLDALPSFDEVEEALSWHLLQSGAHEALVIRARHRGRFLRQGKLVAAALAFSAAEGGAELLSPDTPAHQLLERALRMLAAQAVGIESVDHRALRRTIVSRWIRGQPVVLAYASSRAGATVDRPLGSQGTEEVSDRAARYCFTRT